MFTHPARAASAKASPRSRSAVKTAALSPYGEELVSSRASAAELTFTTGTTGPNVSSAAIAMSGVTPSITVGSAKSEVAKPSPRRPPQQTRTPPDGVADVPVELRRGRLVVERPHRRRGFERVAKAHFGLRERHDRIHEVRRDRLVDEKALTCSAALSCAHVGRLERGGCRELDVGIVEDDHRAVTAELEDLCLTCSPLPRGGRSPPSR